MCEGSDADPSAQAWIICMCLIYMLDGLVWGGHMHLHGRVFVKAWTASLQPVQQILSAVWRNPKASEHCILFRSRDFISWKQQKKNSRINTESLKVSKCQIKIYLLSDYLKEKK